MSARTVPPLPDTFWFVTVRDRVHTRHYRFVSEAQNGLTQEESERHAAEAFRRQFGPDTGEREAPETATPLAPPRTQERTDQEAAARARFEQMTDDELRETVTQTLRDATAVDQGTAEADLYERNQRLLNAVWRSRHAAGPILTQAEIVAAAIEGQRIRDERQPVMTPSTEFPGRFRVRFGDAGTIPEPPTVPVEPLPEDTPTGRPALYTYQRRNLVALDLPGDPDVSTDVQQAAARVRDRVPLSERQARMLADQVRGIAGRPDTRKVRARSLHRLHRLVRRRGR